MFVEYLGIFCWKALQSHDLLCPSQKNTVAEQEEQKNELQTPNKHSTQVNLFSSCIFRDRLHISIVKIKMSTGLASSMLYTAARYIPSLVNKYNSFNKYETHLTSFAFVQGKKKYEWSQKIRGYVIFPLLEKSSGNLAPGSARDMWAMAATCPQTPMLGAMLQPWMDGACPAAPTVLLPLL